MTIGLARGAGLFALWVALIGTAPADLVAGLAPAAAAAWVSMRLLPAGERRVRLSALPGYAFRFVRQSTVAGWDVARRAFAPSLPLATGFVQHAPRLPSEGSREAFASVTALLPGTVPADDDGTALTYHCLDTAQPVAAQLGEEEAAFGRLVSGAPPRA